MPAKDILFGEAARKRSCAGVNIVANAVEATLGPKGRFVVLERAFGALIIANSSVTPAMQFELNDNFSNMGAQMLIEVGSKTSEKAGNGRQPLDTMTRTRFLD
jgi:chaperonin GroEL